MDGLDRLIASIAADADSRIAEWNEEADQYADRLKAGATERAQEIMTSAIQDAELEASQMIARAESLLRADRRKAELGRRQADVQRVIDGALEQLTGKSKEDRVTLYAGIIRNQGLPTGEIVLGRNDQDIRELLQQKLPDGYEVASDVGAFDGGFVIRHGQVEENMTYALAVRNNRPALAQLAVQLIEDEEKN